jgi:hypothetical protein
MILSRPGPAGVRDVRPHRAPKFSYKPIIDTQSWPLGIKIGKEKRVDAALTWAAGACPCLDSIASMQSMD